jgi:mono/diheme cytochrome c family protein
MLVLLALAGAVYAQGVGGDPAEGRQLAEAWCTECHEVAPGAYEEEWLNVPPFQLLADDPAVTEMALRVFFRKPHQGMPDIRLTPEQTNDLVACILSLKGHRQGT